jgi:5S rRNA maturation endonuclease (ribonuclease M5)
VAGLIRRSLEGGERKYLLPRADEFPDKYRPLFIPGSARDGAFLVEGYVDALALSAMGMDAVAIGGTNPNEAQYKDLKRGSKTLYILPDADDSGDEAGRQWLRELYPHSLLIPPEYGEGNKDVADLYQKQGEAAQEYLEELKWRSIGAIEAALARAPEDELAAYRFAREEILPLLVKIEDEVEQEVAVKQVAQSLGVGVRPLTKAFREVREDQSTGSQADEHEDPERVRATQAGQLLQYAGEAELFHSADEEGYATIPVGDHRETHRLRSKGFRRWLLRLFYDEQDRPPGAQALQDALGVLEARAHFDGDEREVYVRVAGHKGNIYLDLGNKSWEVVEITSEGWRIVNNPPVTFRRPKGLQELPRPRHGGDARALGNFINVASKQDMILILAWLVAAMRPTGPYPVLILRGEQGSAKSTAARMVRSLVDPFVAPLRTLPRSERDLAIAAASSWALAFDNVSTLPDWLSDGLAKLATGGGLSTRALYSDDEEVLFEATRPMILNGITDVASRPDLLDRALIVELPTIPEESRQREEELMSSFEKQRPAIIGALLDAVSGALAKVSGIRLDRVPRMADFAAWVTASESALGLEGGALMQAYTANRATATSTALEADPVAEGVLSLMSERNEWTGTSSELLAALGERVDDSVKRSKVWPTAPNALTVRLKRLAPELRAHGIEYGEASRSDSRGTKKKSLYRSQNDPARESQSRQRPDNNSVDTDITDGSDEDLQDALGHPEKSNDGVGQRPPTEAETQRIKKLISEGMSPKLARRKVLGEDGVGG